MQMKMKLSSVSRYMIWSYSHVACLVTCYTLRHTHTNAFVSPISRERREGRWMDETNMGQMEREGEYGKHTRTGMGAKRERRGWAEPSRAFNHCGIWYASLPVIPFGILPPGFLEYHTVHRSSQRERMNSNIHIHIAKLACTELHMYAAETNLCVNTTCARTWLYPCTCTIHAQSFQTRIIISPLLMLIRLVCVYVCVTIKEK